MPDTLPKRRKHRRVYDNLDTARTDVKRRRAFEMRLNHVPASEVAKILGVSMETVRQWTNHEHEKVLAGIAHDAKLIRDHQNHDVEKLLSKWLPMALSDKLSISFQKGKATIDLADWEGPVKAAEIVIKLMAHQAKINGLESVNIDLKSGGMSLPDAMIKAVQSAAKPIEAEVVSTHTLPETSSLP